MMNIHGISPVTSIGSEYDIGKAAKVLLVFRFSDFLVNGLLDFRSLSLFYQAVDYFKFSGHRVLLTGDEVTADAMFEECWSEGPLKRFLANQTEAVALTAVDLWDIQLILTHPLYEETLAGLLDKAVGSSNLPQVFTLFERNTISPNIFPSFQRFLKSSPWASPTAAQEASIKEFREQLKNGYRPFKVHGRMDLFETEIAEIISVNRKRIKIPADRVLVLDGFRRPFYLGDTLTYLAELKEVRAEVSPEGLMTLNCTNQKVFEFLKVAFPELNGPAMQLDGRHWKELDFDGYDLLICHNDSAYDLLKHLKNVTGSGNSWHTAIYHLDTLGDDGLISGWSFSSKLKSNAKKETPLNRLKNRRTGKFTELPVSDAERSWGSEWLTQSGVREGDKVFYLQNESSYSFKNISEACFVALTNWLLSQKRTWVLIFDFKGEGMVNVLKPTITSNPEMLLSAESLTFRQEMCLLSSPFIKGIISPDTGIAHISNGIYRYLINHGLVSEQKIPLIMVYTGRNLQPDYHPKLWWGYTLVSCAVWISDNDGNAVLVDLKDLKDDAGNYRQKALPPGQISFKLLQGYIAARCKYLTV